MLPLSLLPSNMVPKGMKVHVLKLKCNYGATMHMLYSIHLYFMASPDTVLLQCYCHIFHTRCRIVMNSGSNNYTVYIMWSRVCNLKCNVHDKKIYKTIHRSFTTVYRYGIAVMWRLLVIILAASLLCFLGLHTVP